MIIQERDGVKVFYLPDIDAGHAAVGHELGLCDATGTPAAHARVYRGTYKTDCGVEVDCWRMGGNSVDVAVIPSVVRLGSPTRQELVKAMNSFNQPRFSFDRYNFIGPFHTDEAKEVVSDRTRRNRFLTNPETMKNMSGIYDIMCNLSVNNGGLFLPLIARFVYAVRHMPRKSEIQPVGYFDLEDYLRTMQDDRRHLFTKRYSTANVNVQMGRRPSVEVVRVDPATGQAVIELRDCAVIDMNKERAFKPHVILSMKPFELHPSVKFTWQRVTFEDRSVFMVPLICLPDAWKTLEGGIDLMAPTQL